MTAVKFRSLRKDHCDSNLGYVCNASKPELILWFKDGNPRNTAMSNLETLCNHCLANLTVLRECTA
jgi:hypothetical protein